MPIDARIPLAVNQVDLPGSLSKGLALNENIENRPKRNELLDLQINNQRVQGEQRQRELEFDSVLQGALGLDAIIGADGEVALPKAQQAMSFLDSRVRDIESRGGVADDTQEAIQFLQQGDFDSLRSGVANVKNAAIQLGKLTPQKTTSLQQNLVAAGLEPGTQEFRDAVLGNVNKPSVSITNEAVGKGLTEEQKALAKSRVGRFESIQEAADNAIDQDEQLAQLENIDISTGFGVEARGALASAVNAIFGAGTGDSLTNTNLPALQAFRGVSARLVNSELNKAKGPQTEGDAQRAKSTLASLSNEVDANRFLIKSLRATNARKIEQSEFYSEILERDGTLTEADKEWSAFKRKTPMLSASVIDQQSGLPMFFNEFSAKAQAANPDASKEQIINAWRELNE
jgi:hypothetical protein